MNFIFQSSAGKHCITEHLPTRNKKPTITEIRNNSVCWRTSIGSSCGVSPATKADERQNSKEGVLYNVSYPLKENVDNFNPTMQSIGTSDSR